MVSKSPTCISSRDVLNNMVYASIFLTSELQLLSHQSKISVETCTAPPFVVACSSSLFILSPPCRLSLLFVFRLPLFHAWLFRVGGQYVVACRWCISHEASSHPVGSVSCVSGPWWESTGHKIQTIYIYIAIRTISKRTYLQTTSDS